MCDALIYIKYHFLFPQTVFHFDIQKSHFREGLDRFAGFFTNPLMKADSVNREIQAVDSGELYTSVLKSGLEFLKILKSAF